MSISMPVSISTYIYRDMGQPLQMDGLKAQGRMAGQLHDTQASVGNLRSCTPLALDVS